jgi:hypothetical protein
MDFRRAVSLYVGATGRDRSRSSREPLARLVTAANSSAPTTCATVSDASFFSLTCYIARIIQCGILYESPPSSMAR